MSYLSVTKQLVEHPAGYVMNSPLLFTCLEKYSSRGYFELLDVTPANNSLVNHISDVHCKMYLPGCDEQLLSLNIEKLDTETKLNRALVKNFRLYKNDNVSLDLILLWDLPNYLDAKVLSSVIQFLLPHAKNDVVIHSYIHTRENMPAMPAEFRIQQDNKIKVDNRTEQTKPCPMYYQEALQKIMTPFLVEKGILLASGLQEYMLRRR